MTEAEFDSLALTRRRLEEIINSDDSKEMKLNHLCSVVYDAWEHRLSCPDAERDRLGEDESFTTDD